MAATLIFGAESYTGNAIVGKTVAAARALFAESFDIPNQAVARLDGDTVEGDTVIGNDDEVVFTIPTGQKG